MIDLKRATIGEVKEIQTIQKQVFEKLYLKYQDEGSPFKESEASIKEKYYQTNNAYYFIMQGSQKIGYIRTRTNENQTEAKVGPLGILPEYEGHGFGTKAMALVEQEFPTVKKWWLDTIMQESKLTHFYRKLGYKETGEKVHLQEGMDLIFFVKERNNRLK